MAPPKKRTKRSYDKKRIINPRYTRQPLRKPAIVSRREKPYRSVNVPEMVYRLLSSSKHNQGRGENIIIPRYSDRYHEKLGRYQNLEESSYDTSPVRDSTISIDESKYTKSGATSTENLSRVMDATNSSRGSVSWNSTVSNISVEPITLTNTIDNTRVLLKKKSLVQVINSYIKAGIEEGKRQAKKYIRKALSFGMKSGYLIPGDPQGQVIHVSPALAESRRSDIESRMRRRRIRRGEEQPFTDHGEPRKETPPWDAKRKRHREPTPSPVVPLKKRKKGPSSRNLEIKINPPKSFPKKKKVESVRKNTRKNDLARKKSKRTHATPTAADKKLSREKLKTVMGTRSIHRNEVTEKRRSRSKRNSNSPSTKNSERDSRRKDCRRSSNEHEDCSKLSDTEVNQNTTMERRRSKSNQEDMPQESDICNPDNMSNPDKEVEEYLETPSNEDTCLTTLD